MKSRPSAPRTRLRIILETSVLVASSIYIVSKELKSTRIAKDVHYERAMELVSELRKRVAQRVGVCTRTIYTEAKNALRDAVKRCLTKEGCNPQNPSFILNQCGDRLERTLELLALEPIDQERKDHFLKQVVKMYSSLLQRSSLVTEQTTRAAGEQKTRDSASPRYWQIQSDIQTDQLRQKMRQLYDLKDDPPSTRDYEILSEAAALLESYSEEMPTEVYLASTDSSHFSPYASRRGIVSDQVTKKIEETLHVKCDWPDALAVLLRRRAPTSRETTGPHSPRSPPDDSMD